MNRPRAETVILCNAFGGDCNPMENVFLVKRRTKT